MNEKETKRTNVLYTTELQDIVAAYICDQLTALIALAEGANAEYLTPKLELARDEASAIVSKPKNVC